MNPRLLALLIVMAVSACGGGPVVPGEDAFRSANRLITVNQGQTAFGNGPDGVKLAERFGTTLKTMRRIGFTESKGGGPLLTDGEFLTYCQLTEQGIVFLVHVPELRKFTEDAQAALLQIAWLTAQATTTRHREKGDLKLAVGLRGALLYGGLAVGAAGSEKPEHQDTQTPVELERLYPFFVGPYHAAAADVPVPADSAASH